MAGRARSARARDACSLRDSSSCVPPPASPRRSRDRRGPSAGWTPGPIDLIGRDLRKFPGLRRGTLRWEGPLIVPETGTYRLWATGRGRVEVRIAGRRLLLADADPLHASAPVLLGRGPQALEVRLDWRGSGPRLRLGWTRTDGRDEVIPPRFLGPAGASLAVEAHRRPGLPRGALAGALVLAVPWDRPRALPAPRRVTASEIFASVARLRRAPRGHELAARARPGRDGVPSIGPTDASTRGSSPGMPTPSSASPLDSSRRRSSTPCPTRSPTPRTCSCSRSRARRPSSRGSPCSPTTSCSSSACSSRDWERSSSSGARAETVSPPGWGAPASPRAPTAGRVSRTSTPRRRSSCPSPSSPSTASGSCGRSGALSSSALLVALQGLASVYLGAVTATAVAVAVAVGLFGGPPGARPPATRRGLPARGPPPPARGASPTCACAPSRASSSRSRRSRSTPRASPPMRPAGPASGVRSASVTSIPSSTAMPSSRGSWSSSSASPASPARPGASGRWSIAASAVAVVLSLGPETGVYRFLHEHLVFLRGVRALGRFAVVPLARPRRARRVLSRRPALVRRAWPRSSW